MEYIPAKTILSSYKYNNQWFGSHYNMNLYKGCCHGCIYCDSRSDCYGVQNFDKVVAKENGIEILKRELGAKRKKGVIGTGSMSDPYNPFESKLELTRQALQQINEYKYGVAIATKSPLITRDIDVLQQIQSHAPTIIKITITTDNDRLCKVIEPHVAPSSQRYIAIKELSDAGIYAGVLLMPILPFINDNEENIRNIVKKSAEAGAKFIFPAFGVTLRDNQREYYYNELKRLFPKYPLHEAYTKTFGTQYVNHSPKSDELFNIFKEECKKYGILYEMNKIISDYQDKYYGEQISLF